MNLFEVYLIYEGVHVLDVSLNSTLMVPTLFSFLQPLMSRKESTFCG